jgi:hypothetical protein
MPIEQLIMQIAANDAPVSPAMPLMYGQFMKEKQDLLVADAPRVHLFLLEKFLHTSPVEQGAFCQLPDFGACRCMFGHRTRYLRDSRCRHREDIHSAAHQRGPGASNGQYHALS